MASGLTIYKLGGSLLSLPDLPARLASLLAGNRRATDPLLLVGGGPTADLVREWDRIHGLGEERAHWLAIESLRLNAALVAALLPGSRVVASRSDAEQAWNAGNLPILCVHEFLRENEPRSRFPLPHTWDVTSDSIAAWVAAVWPADRLVLLKSVSLAARRTEVRSLPGSHAGPPGRSGPPSYGTGTGPLLDSHFAQLALDVPEIRWVNLREDPPVVESWPGPDGV